MNSSPEPADSKPTHPTVVAVFNPASGGALGEERLRSRLGPEVELVPTSEDDPGIGQAREAGERGADVIVACGGDGTVRACIEGMAGTGATLAIVPTGTGNLLASNLGLGDGPQGPEDLTSVSSRTIDLGRINGESFAVMAGSGFDALMIRDADSTTKRRFGRLAYVISAVRNLRTRMVDTTVVVDGVEWHRGRTIMALIGNFGSISGGVEVFPTASPDDGRLDVGVVSVNTWREWGRVVYRLVRRLPQNPRNVRRTTGATIEIRTAEPRIYELDGEDRDATDRLTVTVEPSALRVVTGRR